MTEDDLEAKVRTWLARSGYPLEMRLHRAFSESPLPEWDGGIFELYPSSFYLDPLTGQQREVDLIASWLRRRTDHDYHVTLTIECKSTTEPWVIFKHRNDGIGGLDSLFDPSVSTIKGASPGLAEQALFSHMSFEQILADMEDDGTFDYLTPGYIAVSAFKDKTSRDAADSAVKQVVSGALNAGLPDPATLEAGQWVSYSVPAIVTTSPLFEAYLDETGNNGEVALRRVQMSIVESPMPNQSGTNTVSVFIFNETALPEILTQCTRLQNGLDKL